MDMSLVPYQLYALLDNFGYLYRTVKLRLAFFDEVLDDYSSESILHTQVLDLNTRKLYQLGELAPNVSGAFYMLLHD